MAFFFSLEVLYINAVTIFNHSTEEKEIKKETW